MKSKFKNILVTGGAGYIGTALTQLLLQKGYHVRVFDSLRFGGSGLIPFFAEENFEFIKGDVRNKNDVRKSIENIDAVIHLAAIVGFPACRRDPEASYDITVLGTKNLVTVVKGKIPILFASTSSIYGKISDKICSEKTKINPLSEYGTHKALAEKIIKKNKDFVIYRFATAFGVSPRMRLDLMPNDFVYRAVKEKSLIVYERKFMRTFIHVRDMAYSFLFALENYKKMKGEIYNVGDNKMNVSKEDVCLLIKKKVDYYLHFAEISKDVEQRDYELVYDKLTKLGFHARISMEEGIDELIKVSEVLEMQDPYRNI